MKREEFEAIKQRALTVVLGPSQANAVLICEKGNRPIHPDELGPEESAQFKRYAEALGLALRDRIALLKMIEDFELDGYFEEPQPEQPHAEG